MEAVPLRAGRAQCVSNMQQDMISLNRWRVQPELRALERRDDEQLLDDEWFHHPQSSRVAYEHAHLAHAQNTHTKTPERTCSDTLFHLCQLSSSHLHVLDDGRLRKRDLDDGLELLHKDE
eukprot:COSAG01_NODE_6233_length_3777_cov_2.172648_2_plen_120_part_00